jgi:hypothetical protein
MKKNRWLIVVISLVSVSVLAIGGVIFYGTAIMPAERLKADAAACDSFVIGVIKGRARVVELTKKTPAEPDNEIAQAYIDEVMKGVDKAFGEAASKGEVSDALARIGLTRLNNNADKGIEAISTLENSYSGIKAACEPVMRAASPAPTATN